MPEPGAATAKHAWSLRRRLLLLTALVTLAAWLSGGAAAFFIAQELRKVSPLAALVGLFGLFLLSLTALLAVGAWMINRATLSLRDSAHQLTERSPDDLRPIEVASPPREVRPLLDQINALFLRFAQALERERRFTFSAAHELRTPLAAVKVHAQVAQLTRTAGERREALEKLLLSIDRASHMVDQLLTLSRVEGMVALREAAAKLRLDIIAAHVIEDVRPLLARRGQRIDAHLAPCEIEGMEFGVASLLRNLVDNSMRYAPDGSPIRVTVRPEGEQAVAIVEDAGPGIPKEERARVFERFYRLYSDEDGCGIGLSIVRTVAQVHRATVDMDQSDLGGLCVKVAFPQHGHAPITQIPADGDSPHSSSGLTDPSRKYFPEAC